MGLPFFDLFQPNLEDFAWGVRKLVAPQRRPFALRVAFRGKAHLFALGVGAEEDLTGRFTCLMGEVSCVFRCCFVLFSALTFCFLF